MHTIIAVEEVKCWLKKDKTNKKGETKKVLVPVDIGRRITLSEPTITESQIEVREIRNDHEEPVGKVKEPHGNYVFFCYRTQSYTYHFAPLVKEDLRYTPECVFFPSKKCNRCDGQCPGVAAKPMRNEQGLLVVTSRVHKMDKVAPEIVAAATMPLAEEKAAA